MWYLEPSLQRWNQNQRWNVEITLSSLKFWFHVSFLARGKNHPEMKHLYLVHEMLLQKSKPFPVNSLVYSFVPAFHCSTRYHGKTDLILVISWSWDGNVSSLSSRARTHTWYTWLKDTLILVTPHLNHQDYELLIDVGRGRADRVLPALPSRP